MNRIINAGTSAAAAVIIAATGVTLAQPASAAAQPHNGLDAQFLRSNEEVNLAEITIAAIELKRATGPAALQLARVTRADHIVARDANITLSKQLGVTLPTEPNAMQQQVAADLKIAKRVNRQYFVVQIQGHRQSIATTEYEILHGIRPRVVAFAKTYLKVAEMHLMMAQHDLAQWDRIYG